MVYLTYGLETAFEDVSLAVIRSGEPLDYDARFRAALVLHTTVRATHAMGGCSTPSEWAVDPTDAIVATIRTAGARDGVETSYADASPLALAEAAANIDAGLAATNPHPETRAREEQNARELHEHAESIEGTAHDGIGIDDENELAAYDARLAASADFSAVPSVASTPLEAEHPTPQWRHVVAVAAGGRTMPMAACKSPARAAIVERALRLLAGTDKKLDAELLNLPNNG